ncbi:hypothetical protein [Streptomyces sp. TRM49041]|nr:hypothetical protein [Streptomyces sp. TRM49041]
MLEILPVPFDETVDTARFWERHLAWWTNDADRRGYTPRPPEDGR